MQIKKRCNKKGCSNYIDTWETYCSEHKQYINKQYDRVRASTERGQEHIRLYNSSAWKNLRYQTLLDSGFLCKRCNHEATIGDHIIPVSVRWDLRLDANNIQPLCFSCHNIKTREDEKQYNI